MAKQKTNREPTPTNPLGSGTHKILDGEYARATYSMSVGEKEYIASKGGSEFVRVLVAEHRKNTLPATS